MAGWADLNMKNMGDPAFDMINFKMELNNRLKHAFRNIDATQIVSGFTANRLAASDASGQLVSVPDLTAWVAGTSNRVTVSDDGNGTITLTTPQDTHTGATPTFAGATLSGLTASRLMATGGSSVVSSVANLASWIAGTANQITVTNDTDGTITLSASQDIHTGASPTFSALNLSGNSLKVATAKTPSAANDTGVTGTICWDASYIYVCTATDTWKRSAIATW